MQEECLKIGGQQEDIKTIKGYYWIAITKEPLIGQIVSLFQQCAAYTLCGFLCELLKKRRRRA